MRILIASDFLPPITGGAETHCVRLALQLQRRGHDVEFVTMSVAGAARHDDIEGIRVTRIGGFRERFAGSAADTDRVHHLPVPDRALARELTEVIDNFKPDVINPHGMISLSVLSIPDSLRPPVVVSMHDFGTACPRRTAAHIDGDQCVGPSIARCLRCSPAQYGAAKGTVVTLGLRSSKHLWKRASSILVVSEAVRSFVVEAGYAPPEKTAVMNNWVDEEPLRVAAENSSASFCGPDPYVLFLGGTNVFKGANALCDVWTNHRPPAELVMIGANDDHFSGPLPDGTHHVGYQPNSTVASAIAGAQLVVVPSQGPDACPGTAIEATVLGVPVVGTRIGGIGEIVRHGVNGLTVPVGDVAALGDAINDILTTPGLRDRLSRGAAQQAPRYFAERAIDTIEHHFRAAIGIDHPEPEPGLPHDASRSLK